MLSLCQRIFCGVCFGSLLLFGAPSLLGQTGRIVDLTYPFDENTIFWPTEPGFELEKGPAGMTDKGYYYAANRFRSAEHGGTHMDAPLHFFSSGESVDTVPLDRLMGDAALIDVASKCSSNSQYLIQVSDLTKWEERNHRRLDQTIVLFRTGFGRFWPDRERYLGTKERGKEGVAKLSFPGLDPKAARWLVEQRRIKAAGIDTASIDAGQSTLFSTHVILCEKGIPALENVANMDQLPEKGFTVIALPMKIKGGSGAPVRMIAIVPM